jgi:hypothetical protein
VLTNTDAMAAKVDNSYRKAGAFLAHHRDKLTTEQRELLEAYASIPVQTRTGRIKAVLKYGTMMHGAARKAAQIMILIKEGRGTR